MQLINPSTSSNELNTTLTPHSITHGDACFAYFNKIWGIPKREGIASEEALSRAMQQPGTIAAIYSLFSKSDGNGHFRRYAAG